MRKFFALALAVAMVLSLASVAFAADTNVASVKLAGPYRYHSDSNAMRAPGEKKDALRYGEGTYYLIKIGDDNTGSLTDALDRATAISAYKEVEKLKLKTEFEMGEDIVESVSVVKKYVDATDYVDEGDGSYGAGDTLVYSIGKELPGYVADTTLPDAGYYYFVEFKVAKKETTTDADIVATIEFNRKADKDVKSTSRAALGIGKIDDVECDVSFNVFYKDTWLNDGLAQDLEVTGDVELKYDTDYALKFDCDDEVELSFGDGDHDGTNEGTFTVDISGQGKVFLRYNTTADEAIAAANPGAKMFFLNFNNTKFNRVGEFVYEMDDIAAAYKVVDGQLVEIKGVELDSDSATFNTRVLESYVFADTELVNPAPAVEAPVVDAPAVTNPSTGAAA